MNNKTVSLPMEAFYQVEGALGLLYSNISDKTVENIVRDIKSEKVEG